MLHFNPHEREARDFEDGVNPNSDSNFNPHEREARDLSFCRSVRTKSIF